MDDLAKPQSQEYRPTPAQTVPLNPADLVTDAPEPEPRIKDPASTISVNTATSFGGTTPLGPGAGRTMKQVIDAARRLEEQKKAFEKESETFINLSTPLNIKTRHGELQAGPGDVVKRLGDSYVVFASDQFEELGTIDFTKDSYDDLLRKTLKRGVIARRLDDGNRMPMNAEQEAEADKNIEEEVKNHREARAALKKHRDKMAELFEVDPNNPQPMVAVDSGEGPPTATPSETATLVPNYIPLTTIDVAQQKSAEKRDQEQKVGENTPQTPEPPKTHVPNTVPKAV